MKPDRMRKHKGGVAKAAEAADFPVFFLMTLTGRLRRKRVTNRGQTKNLAGMR